MSEVRSDLFDIGGVSQRLRDVGRNLTYAITAPLIAAAGASVALASEFDAAMRNVASISDQVAQNFEASSAAVLEWGGSLRSGPIAAAEALNTVMQAGFGINNFEEAMTVAQVAAFTAEAGLADLTITTEALVAALLSYGAGADEVTRYSDILTRMVQVGVGTMSEFGNSLAQVLPSAATLGVEFEQLGGLMAYLTQRGFPASRAATSLGNAFNKLITPSEAMNAVWRELGVTSGRELITTFGGVQGALNAIFEIAASSPDAARALADMFPDERGRRAIQLAMSDVAAFNAVMNEFMADVTGATGRAHAEQMKSFAAQFDLLKSAGSELVITLGQQLLPILTPVITGITNFFQGLAQLNPELFQIGLAVAGVTAAIGPLTWALGTLLTPFGALIGLVTGAGLLFSTNFGGIRTAIETELMNALPSLQTFIDAFNGFWDTLMGTPATDTSVRRARVIGDDLTMVGAEVVANVHTANRPLMDRLREAFTEYGPALGQSINAMFEEAVAWIQSTGIPAFDTLAATVITELASVFEESDNSNGSTPVYESIRGTLNTGVGNAFKEVGTIFQTNFPQLSTAFTTLITNFSNWLQTDGLTTVGRVLGYAIGRVAALIVDLISSIFSGTGKENPFVASFRRGLESGWADAMKDANVQPGTEEFVTKIVAAITVGLIASKMLGLGTGALVQWLVLSVGGITLKAVSAVGLALVNIVASAFLGSAVSYTGWGAVLSSIFSGLIGSVASIAGKGLTLATTIMDTIAGGILKVGVAILSAPITAVILGVVTGISIYNLIPEQERIRIANDFWDWLADAFDSPTTYGEAEDRLQLAVIDVLQSAFNLFGRPDLANSLDELRESTVEQLEAYGSSIEGEVSEIILGANEKFIELAGVVEAGSGRFGGRINAGTATVKTALEVQQETWQNALLEGATATDGAWDDIINNTGNKIQAINDSIKVGGDLIPDKLAYFKNNAVAGLQGVKDGIQPIIDSIVNAWNAMLALIGQQVNVPPPQTPPVAPTPRPGNRGTQPPRNTGNRQTGRLVPVFAHGGFLGAGQMGLVGENGPELVRFSRPATILPNTYTRGEGGQVINQENHINITTNNPDEIIRQLRMRGIDLVAIGGKGRA